MAAGETQNVNIIGVDGSSPLNSWANESTQKQIASSMRQMSLDTRAMIRYTLALAKNEKDTQKILHLALQEHQETNNINKKIGDKDEAGKQKIIQGQAKIQSSSLAFLSGISDLGDIFMGEGKRAERRSRIERELLDKGFDDLEAAVGARRTESAEYGKRIAAKMIALAGGIKLVADFARGAVGKGFEDRFSMIAEMRQAGLLAAMEGAEAGFVSMAQTISETNFTFHEATQFTKQFAKVVGVMGVKSALEFSNQVAAADPQGLTDNMNYMLKYGLEFGQVANIAGEYLDTLRIGGQLRTIDAAQQRRGMDEFMSNVEMTANVLKISMEDAANLMQKALGPESVALLATLPKEQRDAIEEGFLSVNAQGNPMAETLAKRLVAGSRGAFLQTAEFQQMAGTSVGREVLEFVEQMANQLETGDNASFQSALAEGFPAFAEQLSTMAQQGGVRIQLLNDAQLAQMVGSIIEAAQTYGEADKGVKMGVDQAAEQAQLGIMIQLREAAVLNEAAFNGHMERFVDNIEELTASQRLWAHSAAKLIADYTGATAFFSELSTWTEIVQNFGFRKIMDLFASDAYDEVAVKSVLSIIAKQAGMPDGSALDIFKKDGLKSADKFIDANLEDLEKRLKAVKNMEDGADKLNLGKALATELTTLMTQAYTIAGTAETKKIEGYDEKVWIENWQNLQKYMNTLDGFVKAVEKSTSE